MYPMLNLAGVAAVAAIQLAKLAQSLPAVLAAQRQSCRYCDLRSAARDD